MPNPNPTCIAVAALPAASWFPALLRRPREILLQEDPAGPAHPLPLGWLGRRHPHHADRTQTGGQDHRRHPPGARAALLIKNRQQGNSQPDQGRFLVVPADAVHLGPDQSRRAAALIKRNASRLHLKSALRFNTQASPVYLTQEPALGTDGLPSLVMCDPKYDLAAAVWLNTTPGLINLWSIANLTHNGLGRTAPTQVGAMPFLDLDAITQEQLEALNQACRNLMGQIMLPTSEAWQDDVR